MPPLTGKAKADYIAKALANPSPDLNDELAKLGFAGASELAKSRAALKSHIDMIHAATTRPLTAGGAASAYPRIENGAVVGGDQVHPTGAPRLEAAGPDMRTASQRAHDLSANTNAALSAGLDRSGITADIAASPKIANTAGQIVVQTAAGFVPGLTTIAKRAHGEKVTAGDIGMEAAGIIPAFKGPRAVIRAGKAIKEGESVAAAVQAGRASLKEAGPIAKAAGKIPVRIYKVGNLEVPVPAASSRTGRSTEKIIDKWVRPLLSKASLMQSPEAIAGRELGYSTAFKIGQMATPADALNSVANGLRRLTDAQRYALLLVSNGIGPEERAAFHLAQAAETTDPMNAVFHAVHADEAMKASKYIHMVDDPQRGLVPAISPDAPKKLRLADDLFTQVGDAREHLVEALGGIADDTIKARIQGEARVIRGARYVNPTGANLRVPPRLQYLRDYVDSLEKDVARKQEVVDRTKYSASDMKRAGDAVDTNPGLEDRLQAQLDAFNKFIRENKGRPPVPSDEAKALIEERRAVKRLAKFQEGLQKIAGEYTAEAQRLGEGGASIHGTDPQKVTDRIAELDQAIAEAGGRIPRNGDPAIAKAEAAAQKLRNELKKVRANPKSIQDGTRIITPEGDIIHPIGQAALDRSTAALSKAKDRLQRREEWFARKQAQQTGLVGDGVAHATSQVTPEGILQTQARTEGVVPPKGAQPADVSGRIEIGPQREHGPGLRYAPVKRGSPVSSRDAVNIGLSAYARHVAAMFSGGARRAVGRGPGDAHLERTFKGSLLLSGFFKKDVIEPKIESLIIAAKMSAAHIAHSGLVQAAERVPQSYTDIPIRIDPTKPIGYQAKAQAGATSRSLAAYNDLRASMEAGTLSANDFRDIDITIADGVRADLFPEEIDGRKTREIAADIISEGAQREIPNIGWIPADLLENSGLLYVPSARAAAAKAAIPGGLRTYTHTLGLTWDAANDLSKAFLTFLNPAYLPVNLTGNTVMNVMQQGVFFPRNMAQALTMHSKLDLIHRVQIDKAMGHTLTGSVGMRTDVGNLLKKTIGHYVGIATDLMSRRTAFLHEAQKAGYAIGGKGGKKDLAKLLDAARLGDETALHEMDMISRKAQDAIVPFDRMSRFERETVGRYIIFYPWLKGATRYSARFIADHPIQSLAIALAYEHAQAVANDMLGDRPYYAQEQVPISTRSLGFKIPGTGIDVGLDKVVGEHTATGPNGAPLVMSYRQLFTEVTPLELAKAGISFAGFGNADPAKDIVQMLAPVPYAAGVASFGYDPFTQKSLRPGVQTFLDQLAPTGSPAVQRFNAYNMSPKERAARNAKAVNPRTHGQDVVRAAVGGLGLQGYNPDVAHRRALQGAPALERQTKTLILDSKKYGLPEVPQDVLKEVRIRTEVQSKIKNGDDPMKKAMVVAEAFDKLHGTNLAERIKGVHNQAQAEYRYEQILHRLYPHLTHWEARIERERKRRMAHTPIG